MITDPRAPNPQQKTKATYANTFMDVVDADALAAAEAQARATANTNKNLAIAQLDPRQAPVFFAGQAGDAVAGGLNKFFGEAKDSPTVAKARMEAQGIRGAMNATKGITDRKEQLLAIAQYLKDNGLPSRAQEAYARYQEVVDAELEQDQVRAKIAGTQATTRETGLKGDQLMPQAVYRQALEKAGFAPANIDKAMGFYDPATGQTSKPELLGRRMQDKVYGEMQVLVGKDGKPLYDQGVPQQGQTVIEGPDVGKITQFTSKAEPKGMTINNINNIPKNEKAAWEIGGDMYAKIAKANEGYKYSYDVAGNALASARQALLDKNPQAGVAAVQQLAQGIQKGDWSRAEVEELAKAGPILQRIQSTLSKGVYGVASEKALKDLAAVAAQVQGTAGKGSRGNADRIAEAYANGNVSGDAIAIGRSADFTQRNPENNGNSTDTVQPSVRGPVQREEVKNRRRAEDVPKNQPKPKVATFGNFQGEVQPDGTIKVR